MADDDQIEDHSPSPTATSAAAADDDFYSMNTTDDYWRYKTTYQYHNYYDNDDRYYSTKHTTSWLDNLLYNTTAGSNSLEAAVDVNPDNVLATLVLNIIVCIILLSLYEILRRCIPSVYSQRLMNAERIQESISVVNNSSTATGYNNPKNLDSPTGVGTDEERTFKLISGLHASGKSLEQFITYKNNKKDEKREEKEGDDQQQKGEEEKLDEHNYSGVNDNTNNDDDQEQHSSCTPCYTLFGWKTCNIPILEWALPIFATPWSTFRELAGLDAYFYLRYIRLCLKITSVSSFWAIIILCPVYATGGGAQTGFYHYSMANVLQEDKGRVWVPTIFCWTFTMYCWFCVRSEMAHYVELRMQFLGGEEEEKILKRRESVKTNTNGGGGGGYYGALPEENVKDDSGVITAEENADDENCSQAVNSQDLAQSSSRLKSPPPLATAIADLNDIDDNDDEGGEDQQSITTNMTSFSYHHPQASSSKVQKEMKQHRYSLQVEKVPVALRSNTALFNYFNDMFPNQVHSACIAMNIPDLDAMSARRMRVCRRLEKSLAYYNVTGIRPTHIAGRPRCQCCGIESTPIDGWCVACCCFYDSCKMHVYDDDFNGPNDDSTKYPDQVYDNLPDKGERVDSIMYYTCDLADSNIKMKKLQEEKFRIAETGRRADGGIIEESNCDWYAHPLSLFKEGAATAAEGLREEFEVGEDDYFGGGGVERVDYGSMSFTTHHRGVGGVGNGRSNNNPRREPLMQDDHLSDADQAAGGGEAAFAVPIDGEGTDGGESTSSRRKKTRYRSRPYMFVRSVLWQMGVDFLAAGLDEVRNRTDVVVDSVTRPSMSSTGFVTFKTLTPVTVTTSAPLTYNRDPMQVSIAPEPRDLVWQNVQIDADIGSSRAFVANVLLGLGVLLWSIPLTFIQAW